MFEQRSISWPMKTLFVRAALRLPGACALIAVGTSLAACSSSAPANQAKTPASSQPASSQPAPDQDPSSRSASVFVVHQVADFDAYLRQFRGNSEARSKAGVTRVIMTRLADDPERIGLHFSAGSLASVDAFLAGTDYQQLVQADRATESTVLWIASDELDELPSTVDAGTVSLFKKFPVRDVDCVSAGLIASQARLRSDGLLGFSLHRTESNAGVVILHLLAADRSSVERIYASEPLRPLLTSCGADKLNEPILGINE